VLSYILMIIVYRKRATLASFFPLVVLSLVGCGGSGTTNVGTTPTVASVSLSPSSATIAPGKTQQFIATAKDAGGNSIAGVTFTWSSDTPSVSTVGSNGLATGKSQGTAHIVASTASVTGSATMIVMPSVSSVVVAPSTWTLSVGQTHQFSATAQDSAGNTITGLTFVWSSDTPSVATVSTTGLAIGIGQGTAHLTAATSSTTGSTILMVNNGVGSTLFGLHIHSTSTPWPMIGFGSYRLWDNDTRWAQMNTADGIYDFTQVDAVLAELKSHGITDVVYTFGGVPQWASSNPTDMSCDYSGVAPGGGCDLPTDINADGSGSNQTWINFVTAFAAHVNDATYLQTHAHIKFWEPWNEWYRNPIVNSYPWNSISLRSTYAQIVRLSEDLRCTITGAGSVNGTSCSSAAIDSTAKILTPSTGGDSCCGKQTVMQNFLYCDDAPISGSQCSTGFRGSAVADVINSHFYEGAGEQPEVVANNVNQYKAFLSATDLAKPMWSDEGGWGNNSSVPDPDVQASWVARYYLVGWSAGLKELYWYSFDGSIYGTLWTSNGLTKAGIAYGTIYDWVVGSTLTTPCAASGSIWTCGFTLANGTPAQAIWDTSQTCSNESCTANNQSVSSAWTNYQDLTGTNQSITNGTVPVGLKPILLTTVP
jgi:Bacterial Ig-like domain (group 2)